MEKRVLVGALLALAMVGLTSAPAFAQMQLPPPSPAAKMSRTLGLTEISIEYSSPRVKNRKIWGELVPYGQVWRSGANAATTIAFSKDVTILDKAVPAGTYTLFTIPSKGAWTVILSKEVGQWGSDYKPELDFMRLQIKPQAARHRERLAFVFGDFAGDDAITLSLEWEKLRLSIPIKVKTTAETAAMIKDIDSGIARQYNQVARYLLDRKDYDAGLRLIDKSIAVKEGWSNVWTKASLLAAKGNYREAYAHAEKAKQLGDKAPPQSFFFEADVKKALVDWKNKR